MDIALAVGIPLLIVFGIGVYMTHKSNEGVEPPRPGQPSPGSQPSDTGTTDQTAPASSSDPSPSGYTTPIDAPKPTHQVIGKQTPYANFGTIVFVLFAALSLLVCLVRGIVPIYLVESGLWAGLAWYWHKKNLVSPRVNLAVLLVAVFVAAGEGFMVGTQFSGERYVYMDSGKTHYRVNERLGRTDGLFGDSGWKPVSFDTPPEDIPADDLRIIVLSNASFHYGPDARLDKVCLDVQNNSEFVLRDFAVNIFIEPLPATNGVVDIDAALLSPGTATMKPARLLERGEQDWLCGDTPNPLPNPIPSGDIWGFKVQSAKGWRQ